MPARHSTGLRPAALARLCRCKTQCFPEELIALSSTQAGAPVTPRLFRTLFSCARWVTEAGTLLLVITLLYYIHSLQRTALTDAVASVVLLAVSLQLTQPLAAFLLRALGDKHEASGKLWLKAATFLVIYAAAATAAFLFILWIIRQLIQSFPG